MENFVFHLFCLLHYDDMIGFFTAIYIAIMSFFGLQAVEEIVEDAPTAEVMEVPTGNPGQSAPPSTLEACIDKEEGAACSFELSGEEYEGVCALSGEELACTPGMPEDSGEEIQFFE